MIILVINEKMHRIRNVKEEIPNNVDATITKVEILEIENRRQYYKTVN